MIAEVLWRFLGRFGYKPEDIVMLLDNATHPRQLPTRQNMVSITIFIA